MSADNVVIVQENIPTVTEKREDEDSGETQSIKVEGLALPFNEESRNGVKYTKESIKETKEQMIGCSVLWNHDADIPSLGKVVDTEIKEGEQGYEDGLYYTMELDTVGELESKVARKLEKGYISNVSIQAAVDDEGLEAPKVAVKDWYELTICNIAGFPQTTTDTSEQSADGQPAKVKLNGRTNMTEMALAESLDDDGDNSQDDDGDGEENFAGLSDDVADRAEELVNEDNDLSFKESVLQAIEEADDSQDGSDGENENSNKNGASESNSMSGDNSDSGDNGNSNQEQPDDIEEMVEQMQETVNELADRVESVEEQVASMSEADDNDDKNQDDDDMDDEDEGTSKQGFDPDDAQDAAESTRNQIAESLREA